MTIFFARIAQDAQQELVRVKGLFWQGKAYLLENNTAQAQACLQYVAANGGTTVYATQATMLLQQMSL